MRRRLLLVEALGIARDYGFPYKLCLPDTKADVSSGRYLHRPSWNGNNLAVCEEMDPDTIIHELGHWLVCAPSRRKRPEFGLGMSFRSTISPKRLISPKLTNQEEDEACAFEIAGYWKLGRGWKRVAHGLQWYDFEGLSWEQYVDKFDEVSSIIERLQKKSLFRGYGPIGFPALEDIAYHINRAEEELDQWKQQHSGF